MRNWSKIVFLLILPLLWHGTSQFLFCPVFNFQKGSPFSGDSLYNPYKEAHTANWIKCNFHTHCKTWCGITNGKGNGKDIYRIYDSLGYTIHAVSNYQQINSYGIKQKNYLAVYEHGYNINKSHQLIIGASKIEWLDYLFPQTLSNKQWILNRLAEDTDACIILNHPSVRHGYSPRDLQYLTGYHCMEVLNPASTSFKEWDAALSAGRPVFITGNDDAHDVSKPENIGKYCTWVNTLKSDKRGIISALKKGCCFGMKIPVIGNESMAHKIVRLRNGLPLLNYLKTSNDSILISLNSLADSIVFTGQDGVMLSKIKNSTAAIYRIRKEDTYIRTSVYFQNGIQIFLNPVYRYQGSFVENKRPTVNKQVTLFLTLVGILTRVTLFIILWRFYLRKISKLFRPG